MEKKYTPGPWITERTGSSIWIGASRHRTDGKVEEIVSHIEIDPEYKSSVKIEKEANAKLIAAAPELLEALRVVLKSGAINPTGNIWNTCESAIKKATE